MRVALYLRVSTSAQTVENQERELAAVAALDAEAHEHSDIGPDDLQQVIDPDGEMLPHEWAEFWESHYGRGSPSSAFIRGFMKGAAEIHDEIADQL